MFGKSRSDISDYLTHWTKDTDNRTAFENLLSIIKEGVLIGGCQHIKGQYNCVCFTEAPKDIFKECRTRYSKYGIQVPKWWVYGKGGRPVIYQSEDEYYLLDASIRWRHVTYDFPGPDFTWEREWRVRADELVFDIDDIRIIILDDVDESIILDEHDSREREYMEYCAHMLGEYSYLSYPAREFPYGIEFYE
ncbi:hypothetical protein [Zobellella aerophila]|uniref:DUF402 domain-containing protein n=1 Tax=Zobellella aerophila TaxID=870480 RepID=A0ABP6W6F1_9GAMM